MPLKADTEADAEVGDSMDGSLGLGKVGATILFGCLKGGGARTSPGNPVTRSHARSR